ncbi:FAD:protein FMN transferase [Salinibius halmophilus]|uniref:FAD:protein FMN transferase n=1 Tax=Salinibius halmophilus TaxID=1853216 RepID=UPI000E6727FC|nr:FAD:protein FMN transferase [Salinibius halmophilus]
MTKRILMMGSLLASLLLLVGCQKEQLQSFSGRTMGTQYNITLVGNEVQAGLVARQISAELSDFSDIFSTYVRDSEINQISQAPVGEWIAVSEHMYQLLSLALDVSRQSGGAFDPTIRPLVDIWGFGPLQRPDAVPAEQEIADALAAVNWQMLELNEGQVRKLAPLSLDLSAIAKGYGVDVIADMLEEAGFQRYLVEVGGEMRLKGLKPNDEIWRVAVETPDSVVRQAYKVLEITDIALATSGDYRNYFEENGKRYSHTIDPRSGWPIEHDMASVSVLASSSALADAWATAIYVVGPEQGQQLASANNLAMFMIVRQNGEFVDTMTPKFTELVNEE